MVQVNCTAIAIGTQSVLPCRLFAGTGCGGVKLVRSILRQQQSYGIHGDKRPPPSGNRNRLLAAPALVQHEHLGTPPRHVHDGPMVPGTIH